MRGGARRPHARRTLCTLSVRPRAPTKQMGLFQQPANRRAGTGRRTASPCPTDSRAGSAPVHRAPASRHRKGRGANEFTAIFLPWFDDGKNRLALTPEELNRFDYASPAEMRYAERWKLTPEQVMWRRQTIASPQCFKPGVLRENVFQQEYPSHDEEAFLSSGKHFFLLPAVKAVEDDAERGTCEPVLKADIVNDGPSLEERTPRNRFPMKPLLVPNEEGRLFVWKMPNPRHEYLVAVDPAEGLVDGDEAVVYVLDRNDLEYVAAWGGRHLSARELGHIAVLLAVFYGNALLAVEHNNHGLATIEEVRKVCYPYVWHHKDVSRPDSDPTDKVGWVTTQATRSFALLSLEAELRGKALKIHDAEFFSQVRTFMWPSMDGKQRSVTGRDRRRRARGPGATTTACSAPRS